MTHHLTCSLSEVIDCQGVAPQCVDGCVGHLHSRCSAVAKWRITTSNQDPVQFFQNYACDTHQNDVAKDVEARVFEPIDGLTLFGFPIKESRAA